MCMEHTCRVSINLLLIKYTIIRAQSHSQESIFNPWPGALRQTNVGHVRIQQHESHHDGLNRRLRWKADESSGDRETRSEPNHGRTGMALRSWVAKGAVVKNECGVRTWWAAWCHCEDYLKAGELCDSGILRRAV